jgi:hypothetical protein
MRVLLMLHPRARAHRSGPLYLASTRVCSRIHVTSFGALIQEEDIQSVHRTCSADADVVAFRRSDDGPGTIVGVPQLAQNSFL